MHKVKGQSRNDVLNISIVNIWLAYVALHMHSLICTQIPPVTVCRPDRVGWRVSEMYAAFYL